jgi:hypothetical protein
MAREEMFQRRGEGPGGGARGRLRRLQGNAQTDAHNNGREERRAMLAQRRSEVARQLRRLAIELTNLDRQLDEIEQSED